MTRPIVMTTAKIVAVVVGVAAWIALAIAAKQGRQPWESIALAGAVLWWVGLPVWKLISRKPVDDSWGWHLNFLFRSLLPLLFGVTALALGGFAWARPLGALSLLLAVLMLTAWYVDLRRWRAAADEERFFTAQKAEKARAHVTHELPPAPSEPEANRPRAW